MKIRIGTRGSKLALWQAHHVRDRLRAAGAEVEILVLVTRGDRIDDVPLQQVEGKGFFTKEIEDALLDGRIDLAVHSHKDLPVEGPPGLAIAAVPERANPAERMLITPEAHDPAAALLPLKQGVRVGTSSPRRQAQIAALRPDVEILHLRGNVPTRVRRLREGRYDAILLAAAGLERLGLDTGGLVAVDLPIELVVPAPGQGALAIQVREADEETYRFVRGALHHAATDRIVRAERALLSVCGGGCNLALGAAIEPAGEHAPESWRARVFRGADATDPDRAPRWASVQGRDPALIARTALGRTEQGAGSGCGPLAGLRVAITGASTGGTGLGARLVSLGATVVHEAVVECEELDGIDLQPLVAELHAGDAIAVTSPRAARRLAGLELSAGVLVAAVGKTTASALEEHGLRAGFVGSAGARALGRTLPVAAGARVLHPCALDALGDLERELGTRGVRLTRAPVYRTRTRPDVALDEDVDARVYMSPSSVRAARAWESAHSTKTRRIAVGESTAAALAQAGSSADASGHGDREHIVRLLCEHQKRELSR